MSTVKIIMGKKEPARRKRTRSTLTYKRNIIAFSRATILYLIITIQHNNDKVVRVLR